MHIYSFVSNNLNHIKFKRAKTPRKILKSEIPGNMHIYPFCPKCLQNFIKFHAAA